MELGSIQLWGSCSSKGHHTTLRFPFIKGSSEYVWNEIHPSYCHTILLLRRFSFLKWHFSILWFPLIKWSSYMNEMKSNLQRLLLYNFTTLKTLIFWKLSLKHMTRRPRRTEDFMIRKILGVYPNHLSEENLKICLPNTLLYQKMVLRIYFCGGGRGWGCSTYYGGVPY